eukprot:Selendium_serpulae@DN6169_c2_g2_i10.p2
MFIVFEGLDRAGKSTQVRLLCDRLVSEGHTVKHIVFPERSLKTGQTIDKFLKKEVTLSPKEAALLFHENRIEAQPLIRDALGRGELVVADRYLYSGVAYAASQGVDFDELCAMETPAKGVASPTAVLFIDVEPQAAAERDGFGGERYEQRETQQAVYRYFKRVAQTE